MTEALCSVDGCASACRSVFRRLVMARGLLRRATPIAGRGFPAASISSSRASSSRVHFVLFRRNLKQASSALPTTCEAEGRFRCCLFSATSSPLHAACNAGDSFVLITLVAPVEQAKFLHFLVGGNTPVQPFECSLGVIRKMLLNELAQHYLDLFFVHV